MRRRIKIDYELPMRDEFSEFIKSSISLIIQFMSNQINRHPQNAEGKFWIDRDICLACDVCCDEAPKNIKYDSETGTSYVFKQPENEDENKAVRKAIDYCCVEAIVED